MGRHGQNQARRWKTPSVAVAPAVLPPHSDLSVHASLRTDGGSDGAVRPLRSEWNRPSAPPGRRTLDPLAGVVPRSA